MTDPASPGYNDQDPPAPVLVEVTRGGLVESVHRGRIAVVNAVGRLVAAWGDPDRRLYARSAIKPLQAIPLVESGSLDAYGLGDEELALACASHNGEPVHAGMVAGWLARLGLAENDLECGAHPPLDPEAAAALIRRGQPAGALHNNCSGKHAGMLTVACHGNMATTGYVASSHPVQQRVEAVLAEMCDCDLGAAPRGIDGCSLPQIALPLRALALAMARMADPDAAGLPAGRAAAVLRIRQAWAGHPYLIAGRDRFDTRLIEATGGQVLVKVGAEGVTCAVVPALQVGIALKIEDGGGRAVGVALAAVLARLGVASGDTLAPFRETVIRNIAGLDVGVVRAAAGVF